MERFPTDLVCLSLSLQVLNLFIFSLSRSPCQCKLIGRGRLIFLFFPTWTRVLLWSLQFFRSFVCQISRWSWENPFFSCLFFHCTVLALPFFVFIVSLSRLSRFEFVAVVTIFVSFFGNLLLIFFTSVFNLGL
jgi:hypothetical protein